MDSMKYKLLIENLKFSYPESDESVLNISGLKIIDGEFITIVGKNGGGKSTLARVLAGFAPNFSGGVLQGKLLLNGKPLSEFLEKELRKEVALIFQEPKRQVVMNGVQQEIEFGLRNMGLSPQEIDKRKAEVIALLDINHLRDREIRTLSSGELQKVALASVIAMRPRVLILDEPVSHLSPAATKEFISNLKFLNRQLCMTIILIEQELDLLLNTTDRLVVLENGGIKFNSTTKDFLKNNQNGLTKYLPPLLQVCPNNFVEYSVREIKLGLKDKLRNEYKQDNANDFQVNDKILELNSISFKYDAAKESQTIKNVNLRLNTKEVFSLVGENGSGKSTILKLAAGLLAPNKGKINFKSEIFPTKDYQYYPNKIGYVSEDARLHLFSDVVSEELTDSEYGREVIEVLSLKPLLNRNIQDLSTTDAKKVAIASALVNEPDLLILDEPSAGLDSFAEEELICLLKEYVRSGKAVLIASQDLNFVADVSDKVAIISDGEVIEQGVSAQVLHDNLFFTTDINRACRGIIENIVNTKQLREVINIE